MSKKYIFGIIFILAVITGVYFIVHPKQEVNKQNQSSISPIRNVNKVENNQISQSKFQGEEGEAIDLADSQISITVDVFNGNLAHYYNTKLPNRKTIYFFVVKDKDGIYRAAANACQVCFDARIGFRQKGDFMVCSTCNNKYPLSKISTEKGGCNPGPINPNLEVKNNQIIIQQSDLEKVTDLF